MAIEKAFEVEEGGILIENGPHITGGIVTPSYTATVPTLYFQSNGTLWTNPGGSVWTALGAATGGNNFSYYRIDAGNFVTIESGQLMTTTSLDIKGCLKIDGCMRLA